MATTYSFNEKTALVTGASTGIGAEFAAQLAQRGANLVLVARTQDALDELAVSLRARHGVNVVTHAMDLSTPDASAALHRKLETLALEVDILVNNAGFASHGDVAEADPAYMAAQVQLNVGTLVGNTVRFLPGMVARGHGAIINVASTAGFQPVPHMAVYSATKAFVLSFTRSVWGEQLNSGVKVLAVCPGATDTPFFDIAGENAAVGSRRTPGQVVTTALKALGGRKASVVDGLGNAVVSRVVARLLPERTLTRLAERSVRPRRH